MFNFIMFCPLCLDTPPAVCCPLLLWLLLLLHVAAQLQLFSLCRPRVVRDGKRKLQLLLLLSRSANCHFVRHFCCCCCAWRRCRCWRHDAALFAVSYHYCHDPRENFVYSLVVPLILCSSHSLFFLLLLSHLSGRNYYNTAAFPFLTQSQFYLSLCHICALLQHFSCTLFFSLANYHIVPFVVSLNWKQSAWKTFAHFNAKIISSCITTKKLKSFSSYFLFYFSYVRVSWTTSRYQVCSSLRDSINF